MMPKNNINGQVGAQRSFGHPRHDPQHFTRVPVSRSRPITAVAAAPTKMNESKTKESFSNNYRILRFLEDTSKGYKTVVQDEPRSIAYRVAAASIGMFNQPITLDNLEEVRKLHGIGESIGEKIEYFLKNGYFKDPIQLTREKQEKLEELQGVWGVGPAAAQKLYDKGFQTVEDLKEAERTGESPLSAL